MQTNEYFVNGKGLDSDWLNPQTWLTPLSNHEALGQIGVNVDDLNDVTFIDSRHGWAVGRGGLILATNNGGESWRQLNDGKTLFQAVWFTDLQRGWAVGYNGIIQTTDNSGQSWRPQQSGVNTDLNSVQFTGPQHGWVVGRAGVILSTDNGGQSWRQQQSGVKNNLTAVQLINPQHGWAVGWDGIILNTDDGGQSWLQQQSGVDTAFEAVHFTDIQHGWAAGRDGVILTTDNGGQSWQRQQSGVNTAFEAVHFTDIQHGWAVGDKGIILATDNGGQSWRQQQSGVKAGLNAAQFSDPQHGWVVGDKGIILITDNGGQNWRQQQSSVNIWFTVFQFFDRQHGWAVGNAGIILATDNGGQSWRSQQSGVNTHLSAVQFTDLQHGCVVGDDGIILATDNGGQSWRSYQSDVKARLTDIDFIDQQHGWIVGGNDIILVTDDGGQSWQQQKVVNTDIGGLNAVQFIDPNTGWVVGESSWGGGSIILSTNDGGQSWLRQQTDEGTVLNAVHFTDRKHGWTVGGNIVGVAGVILATDDGGKSWRRQWMASDKWLEAVQFADPQHGWAVGGGDSAVILVTDNGGRIWHQQPSGVDNILFDVQFTEPQHSWISSGGIILSTDDGGTTWQDRSPDPKLFAEGRPKLAVFPSPLALLLLLLTGFSLLLHTYRYYAKPRSLQGGISDAPVSQAQEDCLGRLELVKTLADLIRNRDTVPPLAIAITAPWGSGKSSVLGLLQHELQGEVFAVQLNAWHYRDDGQLLAALMEHVREQALPPLLSMDNLLFRLRLLWLRCFAGSGYRGLTALFAGLTATVFFAKQQQWQVLGDWLDPELSALIPAWQQPSVAEPWFKLELALLAALVVYRLLKSWLAAFSAFSPELVAVVSRLGKSAKEAMQVADWSKDAGLRFRFARDFETVAKALGKGRLLLLIDDLDRCEPKQIETVMSTLNFLFSTPAPCYAVLAMDWGYVTDALGLAFKDLAVARIDTDAKGKAFAEHYLEKIIQISIDLPAVNGSRVALIDRTQRKVEEVVDWWGKLTKHWPRLAYSPNQRWACLAFAMLQSPLRLLISVVWRGLESGLWMCWQAIKRFNRKMLTPVYDGLFILVLASALAFAVVHLGLVAQDFASQPLESVNVVESKPPVVELAKNAQPEPEKKPIESSELKSAAAPVVFVDEQLYPTHYWLWDFAGGLSLILLLMVWRLSLRVQDTHVFIEVMSQWQLWLAEHHKTPRDWKRLLNRARLFDMRVRVYQEKPWYAALDEKWQAWRFRRQPLPVPFQHDELNERLAMHLLMLDVYTQGELAESVSQFFAYNKNTDSFNRLNDALMKRPNNFPELKTLMSDLDYRNNEVSDEGFVALKKAEGQLYLWFGLYAGLNTLRL